MTTISLIVGTTREGRFSDHVARWVTSWLAANSDLDIDVLDLRDHPLPFFDGPPPAYTGRDYPDPAVEALGRRIDQADGYIVLAGEYNHGYPAVLKNAMDHTFVEWRRKPISFIGWGNVGGARAIEQLRQVAVEFEMAPLRHAVHILPDIMRAHRDQADATDTEVFESLGPKLSQLVADLTWWACCLANGRAAMPASVP